MGEPARKIFVCYRREDSSDVAGRIFDRLEAHFGRGSVFIDVDTIPDGVDFREHVQIAIGQSGVLLAIIGDKWLHASDTEGRHRLLDPRDYVRIEIESALDRGLAVIPVLVGEAPMPKPDELPASMQWLAFRNAPEVRSGRDFRWHVDRLIRSVEKHLTVPPVANDLKPDKTASEQPEPARAAPIQLVPGCCPSCGRTNPTDRKYCGACGEPLQEPCLRAECAFVNWAWEKFCGACGDDLAATRKERLDELTAKQAQVENQRQHFHHPQALELLEKMVALDHPRFRKFANWARELLPKLSAEWEHGRSEAESLFAAALARVPENDYDEITRLLDRIPTGLQDERVQNLLNDSRSKATELESLRAEIQYAVQTRESQIIGDRLRRFLELKPGLEEAGEIAQQWLIHVFEIATGAVREFHYGTAIKLLEQVPDPLRHAQMRRLLEDTKAAASEIDGLGEKIRQSHQKGDTKSTLLHLQRFLELKPNHEDARKRVAKARQELMHAAQQRSAKREFNRAVSLLEQIPEHFRTNEIELVLGECRTNAVSEADERLWRETQQAGSIETWRQYLSAFPQGMHAVEVQKLLAHAQDWREAAQQNTGPALRRFLSKFPDERFSSEAKRHLAMKEDQLWHGVQRGGVSTCESYLTEFPDGRFASEVQRILSDERAWQVLKAQKSASSFQQYLAEFPNGRHIDEARRAEPGAKKGSRRDETPSLARPELEIVAKSTPSQSAAMPVGAVPAENPNAAKVRKWQTRTSLFVALGVAAFVGLVTLAVQFTTRRDSETIRFGQADRDLESASTATAESRNGVKDESPTDRVGTPIPSKSVSVPQQVTNSIGMKLVLIPADTFTMGSPNTESGRNADEGPQCEVTISRPFYMGVYEVTQKEFEAVVGANPAAFKGPNNPIENVSWEDAVGFCRKLSRMEGKVYRLPTEPEWEFACRAGTTSPFYNGESLSFSQANVRRLPLPPTLRDGKEVYDQLMTRFDRDLLNAELPNLSQKYKGETPEDATKRAARYNRAFFNYYLAFAEYHADVNRNMERWHLRSMGTLFGLSEAAKKDRSGKAAPAEQGRATTVQVGSFPPNIYGLFDMHGNVGEWCADWFGSDIFHHSPSASPSGGFIRVIRGGSWRCDADSCRSAARFYGAPSFPANDGATGFRVVCELETSDGATTSENDPKFAASYDRLGRMAFEKSDFDEAISNFKEAARLSPRFGNWIEPKFTMSYVYRGDRQMFSKLYDRAIADYTEAMRLDPEFAKTYITYYKRAEAHRRNKDYDQAIADYTEAIRLNPKSKFPYRGRADANDDKKEYEKADADFAEALRLDPTDGQTYRTRGLAYYYRKDYDRAIEDYSEEIRLDEKDAGAYRNRGNAFLAKKEYNRAIADYDEAIRAKPDEAASTYRLRADANEKKGDFAAAVRDYEKAIELKPDEGESYRYLAAAYARKGDLEKAIANFDRAIQLDPKSSVAYNSRGNAFYAKKDYDRAIGDYTQAIQHKPEAYLYRNRASVHLEKKNFDQAITDYAEAIRLEPTAASYRARASAYASKENHVQAIDDYSEAIRLEPSADSHNRRGMAYNKIKAYEKAKADFSEVVRIDPENRWGYNNLAWLLATCPDAAFRDGKKAVELATKACEAGEWNDASHLDTLAAAYAEAGNFDEATKWQRKAESLASDSISAEERGRMRERVKLYEERKPYRTE